MEMGKEPKSTAQHSTSRSTSRGTLQYLPTAVLHNTLRSNRLYWAGAVPCFLLLSFPFSSVSSSTLLRYLFGSSPQNLEFFHPQFHLHSHSASSLLSGSLLRHIPLSRVSILLSSCCSSSHYIIGRSPTYPCKFRSGRRLSSSDTNKRPRTTSFCSHPATAFLRSTPGLPVGRPSSRSSRSLLVWLGLPGLVPFGRWLLLALGSSVR